MTRLNYGQFLLSSQVNDTLTYFAHHSETYTHDVLNRYLRQDQITPAFVWDNVKSNLIPDENAYLLFDDTVLDISYSFNIQSVHRQWSGNAGQVINGIRLVTCVYANATLNRFGIIDYGIDTPDTDSKHKPDHVCDMLAHTLTHKRLAFRTVRMDSWYASAQKALLCAGTLSKLTENSNRRRALNDVSVATSVCNAIISVVPSWSGFGLAF